MKQPPLRFTIEDVPSSARGNMRLSKKPGDQPKVLTITNCLGKNVLRAETQILRDMENDHFLSPNTLMS